jgi:hypothetical protein
VSNAQVYLEIGQSLEPRPFGDLRGTTSPAELEQHLTRLLGGSPNLQTPPEGRTRSAIEASLKHTLFVLFQSQSEIANRQFLFHRQGEPFIPQAIKDTLPYFLGAAPDDLLSRHQELQVAKRELKLVAKDLEEAQRIAGEGSTRADALLTEAEAAGLVTRPTRVLDLAQTISALCTAAAWRTDSGLFPVANETATLLSDELEELGRKYDALKDQIDSARQLAGEVQGFGAEVGAQRARLQSIGLFRDLGRGVNVCPVCQSPLEEPPPEVSEMQSALATLQSQLTGVESDRPRLRELIDGLDNQTLDLRRQMTEKRRALAAVAAEDEIFARQRDLDARRSHVVGRISLYLESLGPTENRDLQLLAGRVREAQNKVDRLQARLDEVDVEERLNSILNLIGQQMSTFARPLQTEYSGVPLRLDIKRLTVVADQVGGPVSMERMGSAENWLACHLVAHLALHQYFVRQDRPVPRFLFLDQPTQVYYPPDKDAEGSIEDLADEDQAAVRRIYDLIFDYSSSIAPQFQIVVTDHADLREKRFQEAIVERWRGDKKLVPVSWIAPAAPST